MIYKIATRLEPVDAINIIDSYRHDNNQEYSEGRSDNSRDNQSKDRQLQNQIYMENSVLEDVGHHINLFV